MSVRKFETNVSQLKKFLEKRFEKCSISYVGSGWSSHVFIVDKYLVRFPKRNLEDYLFEEMVCNKLRDTFAFELPNIRVILDEKYPYVMHKYIVGDALESKKRYFDSIGLIKDCALALAQIHSLQLSEDIRKVPIDSKLDCNKLQIRLSKYFQADSVVEICSAYNKAKTDCGEHLVFTHADFHPGNLLVNDASRLVGVIDWCNSGLNIRHNDFKFLFLSMKAGQICILCEEYEKETGISIDVNRIRQLALTDLVEKIFWCGNSKTIEEQYLKKMRSYYDEFVFI